MIGHLIRIAISIALIWWAVSQAEISAITARVTAIRGEYVALAAIVVLIQTAVAALRWQLVNRFLEALYRFSWHWRVCIAALFFGQVLPATVGGDAFRVWTMARNGASVGTATVSVVVDRLIGLTAQVLLIALTLPVLFDIVDIAAVRIGIGVVIAGTLALFCVLFVFRSLPAPLDRIRWLHALLAPLRTMRALVLRPARAAGQYGLGLLIHVLSVIAALMLARAFSIPLGFVHALVLLPPVILLASLPVSVAGWGVRETGMVAALSLVRISTDDAILLSVSFGVIYLGVTAIGAAAWGLFSDRHT